MAINKIEMQDTNGNILYPHTTGEIVDYSSTQTVNQKINETLTNLTNLKAGLATAVNNKTGGSLTSDSSLTEMTSGINSITTLFGGSSDATATAGQILTGKTAYVKGAKVTGTMADRGAATGSIDCGASYTIPAGYHNGSGKVTANSLASQTSATATAGQILTGQTAYVNGTKLTGTMTNNGAISQTLSSGGSYTIPAGYHNGSGKVTVSGLSGETTGTATASNILSGKTAWVNGSKLTGTMANKAGTTAYWCGIENCSVQPNETDPTQAQVTFKNLGPVGYYDGTSYICGNLANLNAANIKAGVSIGRSSNYSADSTNTITGTFTSDATATAGQILSGSTAYVKGNKVTGTMANKGAVTQALNAGGSYTIPAGYHNGSGKITANSLASQTSATASAGNILYGQTAWVGGNKLTGTMTNQGAVTATLSVNGSYTIPAGYHNGSGKVTQSLTTKGATTYTPKTTDQTIASGTYLTGTQTIQGDPDLVAGNIVSGKNIFGVTGTFASDATAAASQILSGSIAYVGASKVTGTMANQGAVTGSLNCGGSYTIPAGYHNGSGKITANSLSSQTAGTATAGQILTGQTAWVGGTKLTGTMANKGAITQALNAGGSYTIPAGYHNGSGKVTANSLASQTSATATAANILSGQTAYVNGNKITGTMANKGSYTAVTSWCPYQTNLFFRFPAGFYSGGTYDGDTSGGAECSLPMEAITTGLGITGDKIVSGNTILGIAGTATASSMGGLSGRKFTFTKTLAYGTAESFKFGSNIASTIRGKWLILNVGTGYWAYVNPSTNITNIYFRASTTTNTYGSGADIVILDSEDKAQFTISKYTYPGDQVIITVLDSLS